MQISIKSNNLLNFMLKILIFSVSLSKCDDVTKYKYETKNIIVPLSPFNFNNNLYTHNISLQLRYLINDSYWNSSAGGPIFLYTGGADAIEYAVPNTGFIWEIAKEFQALIAYVEHRYFGESFLLMYGASQQNGRRYISVSNALDDYLQLITYLRRDQTKNNLSPVITFGSGYGGMLAAYMRMKYPTSVAGALASSAPMWYLPGMVKCNAVPIVTTNIFKSIDTNCPAKIKEVFVELEKKISTETGKAYLHKEWHLCERTIVNGRFLDSGIVSWFRNQLIAAATVNYPYPITNLDGGFPANPVKTFCSSLDKQDLKEDALLKAAYQGLNMLMNNTGQLSCLDKNRLTLGMFNPTKRLLITFWSWRYMTCAEGLWIPLCPKSANTMFSDRPFNYKDYFRGCAERWRIPLRPYNLIKQLGGRHIESASKIIFSNGELDPYRIGGVLRNITGTVSLVLKDAAQSLDLRGSNTLDPPSVINARKFYKATLRKWIDGFRKPILCLSENK